METWLIGLTIKPQGIGDQWQLKIVTESLMTGSVQESGALNLE